jgi:DNA-binding NarL/FixJ family response regulator
MTIRILIADDHDIIRTGLRSVLEADPAYTVVAEAGTGQESIDQARRHHPDLVIMDVSMPDVGGIEATGTILRDLPGTKVLALSMHENREFLVKMLKAGAAGYLLKIGAAKEITAAIRTVLSGRIYLSPSMIDGVVKELITNNNAGKTPAAAISLSPRQAEVLGQIVQGRSMKEIAFGMGLSVKTLEKHRTQLMIKLGAKTPAELTMIAIRLGLVDPWN